MQPARGLTVAVLSSLLLAVGAGASDARAAASMSPVTRVVEILTGLSTKIQEEGKVEEDLYETLVCWASSVISQKVRSNEAAKTRSDALATYIDDLKAGRIELTSERVDLERQVAALTGDIELSTQTREKEEKDYEEAKAEMQQAISALTAAVEVLRTATEGHEEGVLLATRVGAGAGAGEGYSARAKEASALSHAVELGTKVLTKGDSVFLQRLLTGEVPTADWKKLNRKATFKQDYKARSFKIQGVLAKLLEDFASNLAEATTKEADAVALFDKLMGAKGTEKSAVQEALSKMEKESGAKSMSLEEATTEKDALLAQIKRDESYLAEVRKALADKKAEWKTRQELRTKELAAMSQAVAILRSDDSRDLFKRSFASQHYFFLQEGASEGSTLHARLAHSAREALLVAARQAGDSRLSALAARVGHGHFDEVIAAVDSMLGVLKSEEASDLEKKETCESDRAEDTRDAIGTSRTMDELSDAITALEAKIQELSAEIAEKQKRVAEIEVELKEAKDMRDKENTEYLVAKKDDQEAAESVGSAKKAIEKFYADNGLVLAQLQQQQQQQQHQKAVQQPFVSQAGEAPPPPPPTWEAPYGGKTEENAGIVAILGMVYEDILADVAKGDKEEQEALDLYTKTKTDLEGEANDLTDSISELDIAKSKATQDVQTNKQDRATKKGELGAVMKKIADVAPGCDFFAVNFHLRRTNRQLEIDGLEKAKTILSGGAFAAPQDPSRQLKPGDAAALLQAAGGLRGRKFLRRGAAA